MPTFTEALQALADGATTTRDRAVARAEMVIEEATP